MKTNGSFLHTLAADLKRRQPHRRQRRSDNYDQGSPVDLRYDDSFYLSPPPPGAALHSASCAQAADSFAAPFGGGHSYTVEAFEEEEINDSAAAWGTGELEGGDESDGVERLVASRSLSGSSGLSDEDNVPMWGTGELEAIEAGGPAQSQSLRARDASDDEMSVPVWGTGELENESGGAAVPPAPEASPGATFGSGESTPPGAGQSAGVSLAASNDPEVAAFHEDINAILSGKRDHPSTRPPEAEASSEKGEEDTPETLPSNLKPHASSFGHEVFDKMASTLSQATTFNLGRFALERQFDAFDAELERAERKAPKGHEDEPSSASLSLSKEDFDADFAAISQTTPAPAPAPARSMARSFDLRFDVPLVPQLTDMSCWAAGCAMLVAWRDQMSVDPSEIARAAGAWQKYQSGLLPEDVSIFPIWGMAPETAQSYSVEAFYGLLDRYGPLWVASAEPGAHIRVVTGMMGDGTPTGTTLIVNDPWEAGMTNFHLPNRGSQTQETYQEFVNKQEQLARREINVQGAYVAHLSNSRPRP